jgi:hypothetical protein
MMALTRGLLLTLTTSAFGRLCRVIQIWRTMALSIRVGKDF